MELLTVCFITYCLICSKLSFESL